MSPKASDWELVPLNYTRCVKGTITIRIQLFFDESSAVTFSSFAYYVNRKCCILVAILHQSVHYKMVVNNNHAKTGKKFDLRTVCEHKSLIYVNNAAFFC